MHFDMHQNRIFYQSFQLRSYRIPGIFFPWIYYNGIESQNQFYPFVNDYKRVVSNYKRLLTDFYLEHLTHLHLSIYSFAIRMGLTKIYLYEKSKKQCTINWKAR